MKIEKISKNKIKCILTREDFAERKIKMSELAYGSEKAKKLFREVLEQAAIECDFEGQEMPIMVEAIPTSPDSLVVYITKVENPEELDTRFSNFTPGEPKESENLEEEVAELFSGSTLEGLEEGTKNVIKDLVTKLKEKFGDSAEVYVENTKQAKPQSVEIVTRLFKFKNIESLIKYAAVACHSFKGVSTLYKEPKGDYYLMISTKNADTAQFNNACNVACEFGGEYKSINTSYLNEHFKCVIKNDAIASLAEFK